MTTLRKYRDISGLAASSAVSSKGKQDTTTLMKNNQKQVDLMIFDLDGTIVDSGVDIANSINHTRHELGLPAHDLAVVLSFIGDGFENLLQRAMGKEDTEKLAQAREIFAAHYLSHILDTTAIYPGMREVLEAFSAKKKVLITNKRRHFAEVIIERLGLRGYFLEIIGGDSFPYMKPDIRLLIDTARQYGATSERTLVIGDGSSDILLARNGGGISCAHLQGLTKRELLLSLTPDYTYENPLELLDLFE